MKLRIFVIDDEKSITELLRKYLTQAGYEVLCSTEPTACKIYNGKTCDHENACGDILFVDKNMPNMTGLEFIEKMNRKGCKGVTGNKVVMSGDLSPEDIEKARELGCLVLQKPFSLSEISEIIEAMKKRVHPDRKLEPLENIF